MLSHLSINNYALINELSIDFYDGLSIITGETGAGKSILLGALGLVLGNRADLSSLKDVSKKCVVEAKFNINNYDLRYFFEEEDLDYEDETFIRREILPSGKSRAFVNDSPVVISVLNALRSKLIDVHSQHQTLQLSDVSFQFSIIDALAKNNANINSYKQNLSQLNKLKKELEELEKFQKEIKQQYDYNFFMFKELEEAGIIIEEQEILEQEFKKLNNIEDIKLSLSEAVAISYINEDFSLQNILTTIENKLTKIESYSEEYKELLKRTTVAKIEINDIISEIERASENIEFNQNKSEEISKRLHLIYSLQKKHNVNSNQELIDIMNNLSKKVTQVESVEENINQKREKIQETYRELDKIADLISEKRRSSIAVLTKYLETLSSELGMKNARFLIKVLPTKNYFLNGKDELEFLFLANKGANFGSLKKVASGGELSRIMLSIKKILSENTQLPTIILDEIDSGISGEISNKIALIMQKMSKNMQVIAITHLPQIAAKADNHYKVFKQEINNDTATNIKKLTSEERVSEIATLLSGKNITNSAVIYAKELLN